MLDLCDSLFRFVSVNTLSPVLCWCLDVIVVRLPRDVDVFVLALAGQVLAYVFDMNWLGWN